MEGGLLLDVVVGESAAILELLAGEDESLLIGRDAFLILDLGLHVLDGVTWLNLEGDGLSSESLDEDLREGGWGGGMSESWTSCNDRPFICSPL